MKVLDSNIWVKGTLKTNQRAVDLLADLEEGVLTSVMSEYILAETLGAFDRVLTGRMHDHVLTAFLERLHIMDGLVESPKWHTQRSTQQDSIVEYQRNRPAIRMIAQVLDIQIKDVPILLTAFEHRDQRPTVLTNDRSFAECDPSACGLSNLSIQYVE
jgi:predicted nucleic acid-binding protein